MELWNPSSLNCYEGKLYLMMVLVDEYMSEARKHIPERLKHREDVLLTWLVYYDYDADKALKHLISYFK